MANNVYIHIPFCKQKCKYCSFISFPELEKKDEYISALCNEINNKYQKEKLNTLYFGGGTPSILAIEDFTSIISLFNISDETEITAELNPENLSVDYLEGLCKAGINRISIGCQTFNDKILKNIGRRHSGDLVKTVVKNAQDAGFENISLDFIYGLPEQTIEGFRLDLETAIRLGVKHISLYGLKIDKGCFFYNNPPKNLPDDEIQAQMYLSAINLMKKNGFNHYEISNFSIPEYESAHNLNYWNNSSYYGFGVAAHGYINGIRYSNQTTISSYLKNPLKPFAKSKLSIQEQLEEEIFLGLRRMSGIDVSLINQKYNIDFNIRYKNIIQKYLSTNHIKHTETGYRFTPEGILVSNYILADFLE